MRLGVLGGTFDPIHHGHLDVADAAASALQLARVLVVPSRTPPHRHPPRVSAAHRFAMAALAVEDRPLLRVSDLEMDTEGPSYTSITLDRLSAQGVDLGEVYFLTGADAFRDIATWHQYPAILDRCQFVAVSRPGCSAASLPTLLPALAPRMRTPAVAGGGERGIFLVDAPTAAVSSTEVRRRIREGLDITGMVPTAVAAHIARHELYRSVPTGKA
jgi:nicotinate-nucleotide adenylyltransferase